MNTFTTLLGSCLGAALLAGEAMAQSHTPSTLGDMQKQIADLRAQVANLGATESDQWLTEQRAAEIRGMVQDVLADADTRASLLESGMAAGYDGGFFISDSTGNWKLVVNSLVQFRFIYNHQNDSPTDNNRYGFENTRTKLIFSGNVIDQTWIYRIEGNYSRDDGELSLQDAYMGHAFEGGWTVLAGQFKVPMLREELVGDNSQLTVERSLVNQEFTAGRTQGVALDWRGEQFHVVGGFTDGHPATGGFNSPWSGYDTEWALTSRVEWLAAGTWGQFSQMTSWRGQEFGAMIGAAMHYQQGESGTISDETNVLEWTIDGSFQFSGANLMAYIVGRHIDAPGGKLNQYGAVIQGGYFFTDDLEGYVRYEWGDDDLQGEDLSIITAGVNKYFHKQNLKWTTDIGLGLNEVTEFWVEGFLGQGGDIAGWRADSPGNDLQLVIRSQLQLWF